MNKWKEEISNYKKDESSNERQIINGQNIIDSRLAHFEDERYKHILLEIKMLDDIVKIYKLMQERGESYDEEQYQEVIQKSKELNKEKKRIFEKSKSRDSR